MPDDLTTHLAALLAEHEYGAGSQGRFCRCGAMGVGDRQRNHAAHVAAVLAEAGVGFVAEAERERDEARATNDRLNRRVQIAEAAVHELTTGTGNGKARPVAAEMWARCQETHERHCPRAERAEAALVDLRGRVRALAEHWSSCWCGPQMAPDHDPRRQDCPRCGDEAAHYFSGGFVETLRALLDTEATP